MIRNIQLFAVMTALLLSGCVMKSEYTTKLAENEGLKRDLSGLETKSQATEKELADLKQKHDELTKQKEQLEKEKAVLQQENANIKSTLETKRDQLSREVVDLKNRLSENGNRIQTMDQELAARNRHIGELKELVDQLTLEKAKAIEEKDQAIARVKNTYDSLVSELKQEIKEGEVQITQLRDKLTVNLVEKILFDSGSAVIKGNGKKVLDRVADILKSVAKQQIKVEGHTDNVPISSRLADRFPTNWELATARATTVVRYLQERGVNPAFLSAEGYAEYRPVAANDSDEGKAKNRRIEIVLLPLDAVK
ncbi:MAG: OmpA family protein [Nitrospirota bacterium]|nr:OmpA family protein [Nitrospirota bacterium]